MTDFLNFKPDESSGVVSMEEVEARRAAICEALEQAHIPVDLLTCLTIVILGQSLEEAGFTVAITPHGNGQREQVH